MTANVVFSAQAHADPFTVKAEGGLYVRSGPGSNHGVIGGLPSGARIDSTGPAQNGWTPITFQGRRGWVSTGFLNAGHGAGERGSAYTTAALNVRTAADAGSRVVTVLARGTRVETTGATSNGYAQIVHEGALRWVSTQYLGPTAPETPGSSVPGLPPVTGSATATAELMIRSTSGNDFERVTSVPKGTVLQLTGVTENGRTQVIYNGQVRWVNSLYLSGTATVPKPSLPGVVGTKFATASLILRSSANEPSANHGTVPTGTALQMTGRVQNGRAEVVHNGAVRWVTAQYLANSAPVPNRINLPGLTANSENLLRAIQTTFPEARTIYGVRQDPLPDHPSGRALDIMTYSNTGLGDRVANWTQANASSLNIEYIIWNQRIWSVARANEGWRFMADRGSPTANHKDHVHITVK